MTGQSQGTDTSAEHNRISSCEEGKNHKPCCRRAGHLAKAKRKAISQLLDSAWQSEVGGDECAPWFLLVFVAPKNGE